MIIKPPPHCGDLLSIFATGSIVCAILPKIVMAAIVGLIAAFLEVRGIAVFPTSNFAPFGALSIAISLFLGFRNNAAYARWWEGRRQLGAQLIAVRALGRASLIGGIDAPRRRRLLTLVVEHCRTLRFQLRCDAPPLSASEERLDAADVALYPPHQHHCYNPPQQSKYRLLSYVGGPLYVYRLHCVRYGNCNNKNRGIQK